MPDTPRVTQQELRAGWLPQSVNAAIVSQQELRAAWLPQSTNAAIVSQVELRVAWLPGGRRAVNLNAQMSDMTGGVIG